MKTVAEEYQRILKLKHDTEKIEKRYILQVQTVRLKDKIKGKNDYPESVLRFRRTSF